MWKSTTSPMITWSPMSPPGTILCRRHSNEIGAPFTRGAFTTTLGSFSSPGLGELVDLRRELEGGLVHLVRLLQGRHVETEFAGVADVDERVLQGDAVGFWLQSEADHRGLAPGPREEGDRSQISDAIRRHGADPADRPRQYTADQQLVGVGRIEC